MENIKIKRHYKRKYLSDEHRKKIGLANKGKKRSEEAKKKYSKAKKGIISPRKGIKLSEEIKQKISSARKGKYKGKDNPNWNNHKLKGSKNPMWKGGISFEPYSVDWTETLKRAIRERDKYICQLCNNYGNAVHHINYDKKNCDVKNLIILCQRCNAKVNHNRKYWEEYFTMSIDLCEK